MKKKIGRSNKKLKDEKGRWKFVAEQISMNKIT